MERCSVAVARRLSASAPRASIRAVEIVNFLTPAAPDGAGLEGAVGVGRGQREEAEPGDQTRRGSELRIGHRVHDVAAQTRHGADKGAPAGQLHVDVER